MGHQLGTGVRPCAYIESGPEEEEEAFAKKFLEEVNQPQEHNREKISQDRRIREIRQIVLDPDNDSAAIRIDWSENATLFQ